MFRHIFKVLGHHASTAKSPTHHIAVKYTRFKKISGKIFRVIIAR